MTRWRTPLAPHMTSVLLPGWAARCSAGSHSSPSTRFSLRPTTAARPRVAPFADPRPQTVAARCGSARASSPPRRSPTSYAADLLSHSGLSRALNPLLIPAVLIKRALDDLNAVGDAARRVGGIERARLGRLDGLAAQVERLREEMDPLEQLSGVRSHLAAVRAAVEPVAPRLDLLRDELRPIQEMSAVRSHLEAVRTAVEPVAPRLDLLRDELRPIQEMSAVRSQLEAVRAAVEPLDQKLDQLREEIEPIQQLADLRAGIEPLDDDMRQVRESIDEIEPLVKEIGSLIGGLDEKLGRISGDLAPVGELAEKIPGVGRR